jgi:hypothetical protein
VDVPVNNAGDVNAWERLETVDIPEVITPELVADMVVGAIERNAPYCLTHPSPEAELDARRAAFRSAHVPVRSPEAVLPR